MNKTEDTHPEDALQSYDLDTVLGFVASLNVHKLLSRTELAVYVALIQICQNRVQKVNTCELKERVLSVCKQRLSDAQLMHAARRLSKEGLVKIIRIKSTMHDDITVNYKFKIKFQVAPRDAIFYRERYRAKYADDLREVKKTTAALEHYAQAYERYTDELAKAVQKLNNMDATHENLTRWIEIVSTAVRLRRDQLEDIEKTHKCLVEQINECMLTDEKFRFYKAEAQKEQEEIAYILCKNLYSF